MKMDLIEQSYYDCNQYYIGKLHRGILAYHNFPFDSVDSLTCTHWIFIDRNDVNSNKYICFNFRHMGLWGISDCRDEYLEFPDMTRLCAKSTKESSQHSFAKCWIIDRELFAVKFNSRLIYNQSFSSYYADYFIGEVTFPDADNNSSTSSMLSLSTGTNCSRLCLHEAKGTQTWNQTCYCQTEHGRCSANQFSCFSGQCIPVGNVCDGLAHCDDGSDEGYWHARCQDAVNIEACNFDNASPNSSFVGGFRLNNWRVDQMSYGGPRYDHTSLEQAPDHRFVFTDYVGNSTTAYLTYTLLPIHKTTDHCLSFWYFMSSYVGTLEVFVKSSDGVLHLVWYREHNHGNIWHQAEIDLPAAAFPITELYLRGTKGLLSYNNIAVDDISFLPGQCYRNDISCTFELGWCGWSNENDTYDPWIRHKGATPSYDTGPLADMSGSNGTYVYVEASIQTGSRLARLVSRPVSHGYSGTMCMRFYYHMWGADIGSLAVYIREKDGKMGRPKWMRSGQTLTADWNLAVLSMSNIIGPFQVVIEATLPMSPKSDIAIDEIQLINGFCLGQQMRRTTTTTASSSEDPHRCSGGGGGIYCSANRTCLPYYKRCDGRRDCPDGSDEAYCYGRGNLQLSSVIGTSTGAFIIIVTCVVCMYLMTRRRTMRTLSRRWRNQDACRRLQQNSRHHWGDVSHEPPAYDLAQNGRPVPIQSPPPYSPKPTEPPPDYETAADGRLNEAKQLCDEDADVRNTYDRQTADDNTASTPIRDAQHPTTNNRPTFQSRTNDLPEYGEHMMHEQTNRSTSHKNMTSSV